VYLIEIHDSFSATHTVRMPDGSWEMPHRHQWKLRIFLTRKNLNENRMIIDFVDAKKRLRTILDPLEGKNLGEVSAIGSIPTAELVAKYIFDRFNDLLAPEGVKVKSLALCEAEDCWAWYCDSANARL
jgi:6-pyruvoyltetrahydropterin/6-carboxytetrahydropterin synthase